MTTVIFLGACIEASIDGVLTDPLMIGTILLLAPWAIAAWRYRRARWKTYRARTNYANHRDLEGQSCRS